METLYEKIKATVRGADGEDLLLTDAQIDAIVKLVNERERRVAELYEEGWVYVGKRGGNA